MPAPEGVTGRRSRARQAERTPTRRSRRLLLVATVASGTVMAGGATAWACFPGEGRGPAGPPGTSARAESASDEEVPGPHFQDAVVAGIANLPCPPDEAVDAGPVDVVTQVDNEPGQPQEQPAPEDEGFGDPEADEEEFQGFGDPEADEEEFQGFGDGLRGEGFEKIQAAWESWARTCGLVTEGDADDRPSPTQAPAEPAATTQTVPIIDPPTDPAPEPAPAPPAPAPPAPEPPAVTPTSTPITTSTASIKS